MLNKLKTLWLILIDKKYRKKYYCKHKWKEPFDSGYQQCELCFKIKKK